MTHRHEGVEQSRKFSESPPTPNFPGSASNRLMGSVPSAESKTHFRPSSQRSVHLWPSSVWFSTKQRETGQGQGSDRTNFIRKGEGHACHFSPNSSTVEVCPGAACSKRPVRGTYTSGCRFPACLPRGLPRALRG